MFVRGDGIHPPWSTRMTECPIATKVGAGREIPGWSYLRHGAQPSASRIPAVRPHGCDVGRETHTQVNESACDRQTEGDRQLRGLQGSCSHHIFHPGGYLNAIKCVCVSTCTFLCVHRHTESVLCRHMLHGCVTCECTCEHVCERVLMCASCAHSHVHTSFRVCVSECVCE